MKKKTSGTDISAELHAARQRIAALEQELETVRSGSSTVNPEQKLKKLLEILPIGVSILDANRRVVFSNPALAQILGTTDEGLQRGDYAARQYLAADGSPMLPTAFASAQVAHSGQSVHNIETGIVKEDGETIWTSVSAVPVDFPDWKTVLVTSDITERKRLEKSLRESESRATLLFQKSSAPLFLAQLPEATFVDANDAAENLTGYTRDEMIGRNAAELGLVSPNKRSETIKEFEKEKALTGNEMQITTKTGEGRWIAFNITQLFFGGQPFAITSMQDITERKRAEAALRLSEKNFARAFAANPSSLAITRHTDGTFIIINDAYTSVMGYSPSDIIEHNVTELSIYADPQERTVLLQELAEHGRVLDYELTVHNKYGELREILISMEPILYNDEDCVLSAFVDITERKKMEDDLRRSNAELAQFAYVASHDLQEPLRTVAGMVELLKERYAGKLDERADTYITHAVDASLRMQKLINDLLEYSRINRFGKPFEQVSMEMVLETTIRNLRTSIEESRAVITHDPLPTVRIDPVQMAQVLQNLLGNAIKFRSARPLEIHIAAQKLDGNLQFSIRDNGIGIEARHFERIFIVFQRLHTRRDYPGTGIGLSLCKKIIERHGGKIWLESVPGQGTTFLFTIPEIQHD